MSDICGCRKTGQEVLAIILKKALKLREKRCLAVAALTLLLTLYVTTETAGHEVYMSREVSTPYRMIESVGNLAEDIPSEPVEPSSYRTYGTIGTDMGTSLVAVAGGGFAMVGATSDPISGDWSVWLVLSDANGEHLWNRTYDSSGVGAAEWAMSIVECRQGGFAILAIVPGEEPDYGADVWLLRTDELGNELWNHTYGGPDREEGWALIELMNGGFAFSGLTYSYGAGLADLWLVRTDASGVVLSSETYGGPEVEVGYGLLELDGGDLVVAGNTGSGAHNIGEGYGWLLRIDELGGVVWEKTFTASDFSLFTSIAQCKDGGFVLTGYTNSDTTGNTDVWLLRADKNGEHIWNRTYVWAGTGYSFGVGVSVIEASRGGFAVVGSVGNKDALWLRIDPEGNLIDVRVFGGELIDDCWRVVEYSSGRFAIVGNTYSFGMTHPDWGRSQDLWLIFVSDSLGTPRRAQLKLSGEFDFLLKEEIYLQLAALLTDKDTGKPISEATVTFEVYDPDGLLIMHGPLVEEIADSGVYVNKSSVTMKEMDLPKGMYRVHAFAEVPNGLGAMDMIQFHIDPPGAGGNSNLLTVVLAVGGALGTVAVVTLKSLRRRKEVLPSTSS